MTRQKLATSGILLLLVLAASDYFRYPPNPYQQPAIFALGSGAASAGGFCGALPE